MWRSKDVFANDMKIRRPKAIESIFSEPDGRNNRPAGNHVVQKCIERLPPERVQFVVDEIRQAVDRMALHCYGCRVRASK